MLNTVGRMSGIATLTHTFIKAIKGVAGADCKCALYSCPTGAEVCAVADRHCIVFFLSYLFLSVSRTDPEEQFPGIHARPEPWRQKKQEVFGLS